MTRRRAPGASQSPDRLRIEQLTESYRFDGELAALLTRFQYQADGIELTAAEPRPLPTDQLQPATAGLQSVVESGSSLVFVCYDDRTHTMVNPIETALIEAISTTVHPTGRPRPDGGTGRTLGEGPHGDGPQEASRETEPYSPSQPATQPSMGVVTPHNAQRGALDAVLPNAITANTVEKYQGGERDIIAVSATVSDPQFARTEERFILNPRRLLVAISRSRLLTIVVCSTALFEVAPQDSERLDDGPVWARLFTQAVGADADPAWTGSLGEFIADSSHAHAGVPVRVYPSTIGTDDSAGATPATLGGVPIDDDA